MLKLHSIVKAVDEGYGEYIGEIVGFRGYPSPVYYVRILACTKYPSQNALLVKNVHFKRLPYPHLSIQTFSLNNVEEYKGEIPEYEQSVQTAFGQAQAALFSPR
ncbi:MAG: hypothetical protein GXX10_11270 [Clostridiaceae bacterium]|nr:hypothetical protein [Clostridiaceae bacterium]